MTAIERGNLSIGLTNYTDPDPTLPPEPSEDPRDIVAMLIQKLSNLETLVEGKVDKDRIKTEIAYNDEGIKIQGEEIVLVGNVTIVDIVNEQNGTTSGNVDPSITRIIGDRIQTGVIASNNWGSSAGSAFDLDNATLYLGGSSSPKLSFDGTDLTIAGDINTAGQVQATGGFEAEGIDVAIAGVPTAADVVGVFGYSEDARGVLGHSDSFIGVQGYGQDSGSIGVEGYTGNSGGYGVKAANAYGGTALLVSIGDVYVQNGDVEIDGDLDVEGYIDTEDDILCDKSGFFGTDETSGDSSVVIGNASKTGKNTLIIREGTAGSQVNNEYHFYGALSSDSDTTLAWVSEQNVSTGTSPSPTHRIPIFVNDTEYWLYLEER